MLDGLPTPFCIEPKEKPIDFGKNEPSIRLGSLGTHGTGPTFILRGLQSFIISTFVECQVNIIFPEAAPALRSRLSEPV